MADVENSASNRVLQKVGMKFSGTFFFDETEHYFYKISRKQWSSTN
jgi:RimJ/RimL family protein N-acetyltransferase